MRRTYPVVTRFIALVALSIVGCATSSTAVQGDGGPCESSADCISGLVCKAARCGPAQSRVGDVCVTQNGCEAGLLCIKGRCTTGLADVEAIEAACARLTALYRAQLMSASAGPGAAEDLAALNALALAFAQECEAKLVRSQASHEQAACIATAQSIDAATKCP